MRPKYDLNELYVQKMHSQLVCSKLMMTINLQIQKIARSHGTETHATPSYILIASPDPLSSMHYRSVCIYHTHTRIASRGTSLKHISSPGWLLLMLCRTVPQPHKSSSSSIYPPNPMPKAGTAAAQQSAGLATTSTPTSSVQLTGTRHRPLLLRSFPSSQLPSCHIF